MRTLSALVVSAALLLAACGSGGGPPPATSGPAAASPSAAAPGGPEILPILINSELVTGSNRFLFSLTDRENRLIAAPDVEVHLLFYDIDVAPETVVFEADARFLWAIEDVQGLYVANVSYPDDGRWGTRFQATFPDGAPKTVRVEYDVRASGSTPAIGATAPSVDTPTAGDVGGDLARVTTDSEPDPRFYETSIAEALAAGRPFVVTFATPAFCETRLCGPALETVKEVARDYPDVTFINVEPYEMAFTDGRLQPVLDENGQLTPAAWTNAWGLLSEPYTFVVAAGGSIAAKFEGVLGADELRDALDAL